LRALAPDLFEELGWKLIWNSSEEQFSPDFATVCRERLTPETLAALVFEAEGRKGNSRLVVVARKGRATWRATARGRGSHAGGKHAHGVNAIEQLAHVVQRIAGLTDYQRNLTFNVGRVLGGTVLNRVPHEAVAEGEFRAFTAEIFQKAKTTLLALNGNGAVQSSTDGYTGQVQIEVLTECRPWPRNAATDRLFEVWRQAGESLGIAIGGEERGGLSDGNALWDQVPTIDGLGPWGDNDHCSERSSDGSKMPEFVEPASFVPKALVNIAAILRLTHAA
jgi:glutamate carboxypeptidase